MPSSKITTNTPTAPEIPSKLVQDILATTGENVPEMFTRESGDRTLAADPSALPMMDCPVIDLSLLAASHAEAQEELRKFHSALASWGSFQIINHGLTDSFLDETRELIREFFLLPLEERKKYLRTLDNPEGYGNDTVLSQHVPHNWNDRLFLKVFPESARNLKLWPQTPSGFREMLHEFTMKAIGVHETLLIAVARALGLEDNSFLEECGESVSVGTRINFYPKCPFPELVRASRAHTDASIFTILLQDKQVDGLQVLKDDKWFKVPIVPSALFVNTGDQLEIMSNGKFKGVVHRVMANSEKERLSSAMFIGPDNEKVIGPLKQLVTESEPALYKSTSNYSELFFRHHPKGERPISAMKL